MRYILKFILFFYMLSVVLSAVFLEIQKSNNGTCKSNSGKYYNPGESWDEEDCTNVICHGKPSDGDSVTLNYRTCGVASIEVPPGCEAVRDMTKKYPHCCMPKLKCPDKSSTLTKNL